MTTNPLADSTLYTLTPLWGSDSKPLRKTWTGVGNIDQFRWLARADVLEHLTMARDELGLRHVRACAMYGPEMRILRRPLVNWNRKPENPIPEPNWQMVDLTIERLLDLGLKPIYTTCFTPPGFTDSPKVCWPDGNPIGMPRDPGQWADFVTHGLEHHLRRFGRTEMRSWYFECWNEPNLSGFFSGTREDFFQLWSATWRAVKAVDPEFRFGGPSTARAEWVPEFLDHAAADGTMPDYVATHVYNNDSESEPLSPFDGPASHRVKDSPHFASGVIRGLRAELDRRDFKGEVHWNEWGRSWFPHDPRRESGMEAAFIVKTMKEVSQCGDAFAFWCLSDIYDQIGFQASEFEGHYGMLSLHGLRKPAWQAHRLLNRLHSNQVVVTGGGPLLDALATQDQDKAAVLVFGYLESPESPEATQTVNIVLPPGARTASVTYLDAERNNIIHRWKEMGAPQSPTREELAQLRETNRLESSRLVILPGFQVEITLSVPGVALIEAES